MPCRRWRSGNLYRALWNQRFRAGTTKTTNVNTVSIYIKNCFHYSFTVAKKSAFQFTLVMLALTPVVLLTTENVAAALL